MMDFSQSSRPRHKRHVMCLVYYSPDLGGALALSKSFLQFRPAVILHSRSANYVDGLLAGPACLPWQQNALLPRVTLQAQVAHL